MHKWERMRNIYKWVRPLGLGQDAHRVVDVLCFWERYTNLADSWPPPPNKARALVCGGGWSTTFTVKATETRARRGQAALNKASAVSHWQLVAGEPRSTSHRAVVSRNGFLVSDDSNAVCRTYYYMFQTLYEYAWQ